MVLKRKILMDEPISREEDTFDSQVLQAVAMKLKELRKQRNWSQDDLAQASGVPQRSISSYERQQKEPSFSAMVRLARALKVPLDAFIDAEAEHAKS